MFVLAVLIGLYSYLVFGLGLLGRLDTWILRGSLFVFIAIGLWFNRGTLTSKWFGSQHYYVWLIGGLTLVNLIGALGPELSFDALWYHLTIPRIWLLEQRIFFISSGHFYYSLMPKLFDVAYLGVMSFSNEIGPKVLHWGMGLLILPVIYKLARKHLDHTWSLLSVIIFYANLVVGWQATTAYIDLGRTFFEVLAFLLLLEEKTYKSAVVLGLAVSTKLLALGSLPIFLILLLFKKAKLKTLFGYAGVVLLIPLPWFVFAWVNSGNPFYPVFSGYDLVSVRSLWDFITIWLMSADPISPIYLMVLPLVIWHWRKIPRAFLIYCGLALVVWWITPRTGGGRFLMPYLPVMSVVVAITIHSLHDRVVQKLLVGIVLTLMSITIVYRGVANFKFIPYLVGRETKQEFLDKYLNQNFGNNYFYLPDAKLRELYE